MRNLSLDYFKVFLAFCVVCLHGGFFYDINEVIGYLHVNGLFRIAVPLSSVKLKKTVLKYRIKR